jgi:GST-like protein
LPRSGNSRYAVLQWLEWQVSGLGPMMGQVNHFCSSTMVRIFDSAEALPYAQKRYLTEVKRLLDVLDRQLASNQYVAGGEYSIADVVRTPSMLKLVARRLGRAQYTTFTC